MYSEYNGVLIEFPWPFCEFGQHWFLARIAPVAADVGWTLVGRQGSDSCALGFLEAKV
jgi:hypothetical protein